MYEFFSYELFCNHGCFFRDNVALEWTLCIAVAKVAVRLKGGKDGVSSRLTVLEVATFSSKVATFVDMA